MAGGIPITVDNGNHDDTPTEGSRRYAIIVCAFASLGGLFFGYDQGVTGGVLVMRSFIEDFCVGEDWHGYTYEECDGSTSSQPGKWTDFQQWYNTTYNLGCMFGALVGGWVADKFGRRVTIFNAGVLFCIGTSWVCFNPAGNHGLLLAARVVQGMGVGNSSFSLPVFSSEVAPKELRGLFSGFMQMTVVTGLLLANIVNQIVQHHDRGWRTTNGIAMAAPIVVLLGIFFVPESPRWTYVHKGRDAAEAVLKRLRDTDNVERELQAIGDQLEQEGQEAEWSDLLEPSILKRVGITMFLQVLQQATGINPMFAYGGLIFKDIAGDGVLSVLFLSIINFVSTIPALRWVDQYGRRQLLLIGGVGMIIGHLVSGITFSIDCDGNTEDAGCSDAAGYVIIVGTSFFVFNFAMSWGPVCWVYPAEVFPTYVRAKAVSLSTMANWAMGVVMTYVVKLFPHLNIDGVFYLFAGTCAISLAFVFFFCPETKGLLLEDIEVIFSTGKKKKKAQSPKYAEVLTPVTAA